ncbi:hypothetical protein EZ428_20485 [Pedobacter frigiditerrae]|uniref:Uncharacterized protein n=1 Tax=Pedobacter frigiditerrae TaxID=2530452 RepID=A0A4R0MMX2_9SPHI|nr:hypothetical protein [Pedobacter frigiditerrae]TCC88101.1 hypothetical protein EZ428_20485 [Pedobacter frigiditerrae]
MKQRLITITSILVLSLLTQNTFSQGPITSPQSAAKTQQVPVKKQTPVKKYILPRRYVDTVKNTDFSLNGQYQFMLSRSKSINGYKLINPGRLATVWQSALDTLKKERIELNKVKTQAADHEKTITTLRTEVDGKETTLNNTNAKIDEINFLGLSFTKGTYNIIVWSIILVLAIALFVVVARSAKNILEAKHRTQLYDEISTEFQAYKAKSNEQQRKLARELQDERNIIEEMKSKGK